MSGPTGHGPTGSTSQGPTGPTSRRWLRGLIRDLVLMVTAGALVLAGLSLLTLSGEEALDQGTGRTGAANVVDCRRVGPLSGSGLGYWWTCTVEVRWDDGDQDRYDLPGSRFTPADRAQPVAVREVARSGRGNLDADTRPVRADRPARVGFLAVGLLTFLAGALCALPPVKDVVGVLVRVVRRTVGRARRGR